jgi:hypothetical protein
MKFSIALTILFLFCGSAYAKSKDSHSAGAGSICIAPPGRPTAGQKSLSNPAGGNPISVYSIQVDKRSPVVASNDRPVKISSISTGGKHLVKIIGDGKIVQSFWLNFGKFKTRDLCLFFNSLYQTWSLWDGKEGRGICRCK